MTGLCQFMSSNTVPLLLRGSHAKRREDIASESDAQAANSRGKLALGHQQAVSRPCPTCCRVAHLQRENRPSKRLRSAGAASAAEESRLCHRKKRRQPASSQGISRAAELKPLSHAFSGAVPGTHPAACKRPQNRPRRGAAEPQNPAPRPNRPPGKKAHASPDRGGREASNEPL